MDQKKIILLTGFAIIVACFFLFDINQYLNLEYLKSRQSDINTYYTANPIKTGLYFFITYILVTAVSLPGAGIMTLAGGAIFGVLWGTILVSFASVIGATIAFLIARYLFHDYIQQRFSHRLVKINKGVREEGDLYLFTIRLVPIFPFFIVNSVMALTPIKTLNFAIISQIGMLLPTIIFVNAGTQLAKIESPGDVLSLELLFSFLLLGLFPFIAKKALIYIRKTHHESLDVIEDDDDDETETV